MSDIYQQIQLMLFDEDIDNREIADFIVKEKALSDPRVLEILCAEIQRHASTEHYFYITDVDIINCKCQVSARIVDGKILIDVDGNIIIDDYFVNQSGNIRFNFGIVNGNCVIGSNSPDDNFVLQSLEGCPEVVSGTFQISGVLKLKNLVGCPKSVRNINLKHLSIESLEGFPGHVHDSVYIYCCTMIESLEGLPSTIRGNLTLDGLFCLESFKGGPKKVGGHLKIDATFDCDFDEMPAEVGELTLVENHFESNISKPYQNLKKIPFVHGNILFEDINFSEGFPDMQEIVFGNFIMMRVVLKDLKKIPRTIQGDLEFEKCTICNREGMPPAVMGEIIDRF